MKKLVLGFCLLFSINLYADLVANGFSQYNNNHYREAIGLWTQACDNGNMDGCYNLAYMYANGKGTLHNEKIVKHVLTLELFMKTELVGLDKTFINLADSMQKRVMLEM